MFLRKRQQYLTGLTELDGTYFALSNAKVFELGAALLFSLILLGGMTFINKKGEKRSI